jgi:hypothetical protein
MCAVLYFISAGKARTRLTAFIGWESMAAGHRAYPTVCTDGAMNWWDTPIGLRPCYPTL